MDINILIKNKIASSNDAIVNDNTDYIAVFTFDSEEWSGVKTARFVNDKGQFEERIFEGNKVNIPRFSNTSYILVGIYAGNIKTTTPAMIKCKKSILAGGGTSLPENEDVYAQIMERLNNMPSHEELEAKAETDLSNVSNADFKAKADAAGVGGGGGGSVSGTFIITGQFTEDYEGVIQDSFSMSIEEILSHKDETVILDMHHSDGNPYIERFYLYQYFDSEEYGYFLNFRRLKDYGDLSELSYDVIHWYNGSWDFYKGLFSDYYARKNELEDFTTKEEAGTIAVEVVNVYANYVEEYFAHKATTLSGYGITDAYTKSSVVKTVENNTLVLTDNQEVRLGEILTLTLSVPAHLNDLYHSEFSFASGDVATSLVYSSTPIIWCGDDCNADGEFIPETNTKYEVSIKKLGNDLVARVGAY